MRVQIEFLDRGTPVTDHEIVYDSTVPVPQVGEVVAVPGGRTYTVTNRLFHYLGGKMPGFPDVKVTLFLESRHPEYDQRSAR